MKERKFENGDAVRLRGTKKSHGDWDDVLKWSAGSHADLQKITARIHELVNVNDDGENLYDVTIDPKFQKYFHYKGMMFTESDLIGLNETPEFLPDSLFDL